VGFLQQKHLIAFLFYNLADFRFGTRPTFTELLRARSNTRVFPLLCERTPDLPEGLLTIDTSHLTETLQVLGETADCAVRHRVVYTFTRPILSVFKHNGDTIYDRHRQGCLV
jgi:hypothetical protein